MRRIGRIITIDVVLTIALIFAGLMLPRPEHKKRRPSKDRPSNF